jgi:hypothetical protein
MNPFNKKNRQSQVFVHLILVCILTFYGVKVASGANFILDLSNSDESLSGEWVADFKQIKTDEIHLIIIRGNPVEGDGTRSSEDLSLSELQGLSRELAAGEQNNVKFRLMREAGTFECEGSFREGRGRGSWILVPNQNFISSMQNRGYDLRMEKDLFRAALFNINIKSVEELKNAGYDRLSLEDLVRSNIFKVTGEFIREMKSIGFENLSFEDLVRARIFKIDTQFSNEVAAMGFERQSLNMLIDLRLAKVTSEFVNEIKAEGFSSISPREAIELKTQGVNRDFIRRVKAKGYTDVTLKQLIEIRKYDIIK